MSPRAAWRLESLQFQRVFDYVGGKRDWAASALPTEGAATRMPRALHALDRHVTRCKLSDCVADVRARATSGEVSCVVVNDADIVLGRLRRSSLAGRESLTVEQVMENGPTTIRPNEELASIVARMQDARVQSVIVATPDGKLLGILLRRDAEVALHRAYGVPA